MTTQKPKKQRVKDGDILAIPLKNNKFAYGRIIKSAIAIYNYVSDEISNSPDVSFRQYLFIVPVYKDVLASGFWKKIGSDPMQLELPKFYKFDPLDEKYSIYNSEDDSEIEATEKECTGLECLAIWHKEIVEDRIISSLAGQPSKWVSNNKWCPYPIEYSNIGEIIRKNPETSRK